MFGYVLPPLSGLPPEESERFQRVYCGLCHTLKARSGAVSRLILNYDFTFLAILLSGGEEPQCRCGRCPASPLKKREFQAADGAMELAADESVILSYWQLRDGIADHGFWRGLKYRVAASALLPAYRRAARSRSEFDTATQRHLKRLAELERGNCPSLDQTADTFAELLAAAADDLTDERQKRILHQLLYHLGRWIYLIDAADDLKKDFRSGNYNPLIPRFALEEGIMDDSSRKEFTATLDHSVHMIATAYELGDFGAWSAILMATIYQGLFQVGKSVLDGNFHTGFWGKKKDKIVEETA